jgi:D-threo-aldose 1-dehydrogenase
MADACERHGVPLAAAALQFSLRAPFVDSTVVGMSSPERVTQTLGYASLEIPDALWEELETLVPSSENWLN